MFSKLSKIYRWLYIKTYITITVIATSIPANIHEIILYKMISEHYFMCSNTRMCMPIGKHRHARGNKPIASTFASASSNAKTAKIKVLYSKFFAKQ